MSRRSKAAGHAEDAPDDEDMRRLLALYLGKDDDAFDEVSDAVRDDPERAWSFVRLACRADLSVQDMAYISAGPFEDLLGFHGAAFIDRVEVAAQRDASIRTLLSLVWRGGMSADVWSRVETLRAKLRIQPH